MEKQVYITEEERVKCQKVVDAFAELYEIENIVVLDAGRYGFIELKYYKPPHGFEDAKTFTDRMAEYKAVPDSKRHFTIGEGKYADVGGCGRFFGIVVKKL